MPGQGATGPSPPSSGACRHPLLCASRHFCPRADSSRSEEHTSELQSPCHLVCHFFFLNNTAPTEIYTLSLHDALPISSPPFSGACRHPLLCASRHFCPRADSS